MQIDKLRSIIAFNKQHQKEIEDLANFIGLDNDINTDIIDIRNVLREVCEKQSIELFEIPIQDKKLGAVFFVQDQIKYILLNSNVPKVNLNFAIAHELYHIYVENSAQNYNAGDVFVINEYQDNENEMLANAFAAELLMPKAQINYIYNFFSKDYQTFEVIIKLMNYFSTPYISVLIKLLEIGKLKDYALSELLNKSESDILEASIMYGLDVDLLKPSQKDDSKMIIKKLKDNGNQLIEKGLISQIQLKRIIDKVEKTLKKLSGN